MDTARQAGVEAANRPHDVDTLEGVRAVVFEDGRVLHGILVGAGRAIDVSHTAVPGCGRIRMVVGDLPVLNDHVMGEHASYRFMEPAADGLLRHSEITPGFGVAGAYLI